MSMMVMLRGKECLLGVMPSHVGEDSVLDVTTEDTLLGKRDSVFSRVDSPSVGNNYDVLEFVI